MNRKIIKTVVIGDENYTQDEITRTSRNLNPFIRHAIRRGQHRAIYAEEFAEIAAQCKKLREEKEELGKQLELSL